MKEYGYGEDVWGAIVDEFDRIAPRIQELKQLFNRKEIEYYEKDIWRLLDDYEKNWVYWSNNNEESNTTTIREQIRKAEWAWMDKVTIASFSSRLDTLFKNQPLRKLKFSFELLATNPFASFYSRGMSSIADETNRREMGDRGFGTWNNRSPSMLFIASLGDPAWGNKGIKDNPFLEKSAELAAKIWGEILKQYEKFLSEAKELIQQAKDRWADVEGISKIESEFNGNRLAYFKKLIEALEKTKELQYAQQLSEVSHGWFLRDNGKRMERLITEAEELWFDRDTANQYRERYIRKNTEWQ